jgi:hypothetical protein
MECRAVGIVQVVAALLVVGLVAVVLRACT